MCQHSLFWGAQKLNELPWMLNNNWLLGTGAQLPNMLHEYARLLTSGLHPDCNLGNICLEGSSTYFGDQGSRGGTAITGGG